jgi:Uri superfamily endonuclease
MQSIETLPALPGSYALHIMLCAPLHLFIGRLGRFAFPAGDYIYLGSACGPGGLRARVRHHARDASRPRWHLDWLRPHGILAGGWYVTGRAALECTWSQSLAGMCGAVIPAPGFGASDCRCGCTAHLVAFPGGADLANVSARLSDSVFLQLFSVTRPESREKVE